MILYYLCGAVKKHGTILVVFVFTANVFVVTFILPLACLLLLRCDHECTSAYSGSVYG